MQTESESFVKKNKKQLTIEGAAKISDYICACIYTIVYHKMEILIYIYDCKEKLMWYKNMYKYRVSGVQISHFE